MENKHIQELLKKTKGRLSSLILQQQKIETILVQELGIETKKQFFSIKKNKLKLTISPILRSEVVFKKSKILSRIKTETGAIIKDILF